MIGRTNIGGGGSLRDSDAILRVIAPAGSTVTISKGGVSKSDAGHENAADNTLYDYYFIIHQSQFDGVNPWTVTATLGGDTESDTIIIDSADEYDVELRYELWLIENGAYTGSGGITFSGRQWKKSGYTTVGTVTLTTEQDCIQLDYYNTKQTNDVNGYAGICTSQFNAGEYSTVHFRGRFKWATTTGDGGRQCADMMINTDSATNPNTSAIAFKTLVPNSSVTDGTWVNVETDMPITETAGNFVLFIGLMGLYYNRHHYIQVYDLYLK